jgi:hypothetical protein
MRVKKKYGISKLSDKRNIPVVVVVVVVVVVLSPHSPFSLHSTVTTIIHLDYYVPANKLPSTLRSNWTEASENVCNTAILVPETNVDVRMV